MISFRLLLGLGFVGLLTGSLSAAEPPRGSLEELYELERLAYPRTSTTCRMFSSYDRTGGNNDGFQGTYSKLRVEDGDSVIAEMEGAGCIQRMWFTHSSKSIEGLLNREQEHIRIYLDGGTEPVVDVALEELFSGELDAFPSPLVGAGAGGFYSYVPIAYQNGCKVVIEGTGVRFYQVTYNQFDEGRGVESFSMELSPEREEQLERAVSVWSHPGDRLYLGITKPMYISGTLELASGDIHSISLPEGKWMVRALELEVDEAQQESALEAGLKAYWDGSESPAVDVPLGMLFAQGLAPDPYASLLAGSGDQRFYLFMPMPYQRNGRLDLTAEEAFSGTFTVVLEEMDEDAGTPAYFHASAFAMTPTESGLSYPILNTTGTGHVVGFHLATESAQEEPVWLEGDEQFSCDGDLLIHGTGTEDYFNCGWYALEGRLNGAAAFPLHGFSVYRKQDEMMQAAAYRWHLTDPVVYQGTLRSDIEHGPRNNIQADYQSVVYFYDTRAEGIPVEVMLPAGNDAIYYVESRLPQWGHADRELGLARLTELAELQERDMNRAVMEGAAAYLKGMAEPDDGAMNELESAQGRLQAAIRDMVDPLSETMEGVVETATNVLERARLDLKQELARTRGFDVGDEVVVEARDIWGDVTAPPEYTETADYQNSTAKVDDPHLIGIGARFTSGGLDSEARFTPDIPREGVYEVYTIFSFGSNASDTKYVVRHADGNRLVAVPQRGRPGTADRNNAMWIPLGTYRFEKGANRDLGSVALISGVGSDVPNEQIDYRAYADSVRFVYRGEEMPEGASQPGEEFLTVRDGVLDDFEGASAMGWKVISGNLHDQPTESFRKGIKYGHQGTYLIATTETGGTLAKDYNDRLMGTVQSPPFIVEGNFMSFLIGGGKDPQNLRVVLVRECDGYILNSMTGTSGELMSRHYWDVSDALGEVVRLQVRDHSPGDWGHLNLDDIRVHDEIPPDPFVPLVIAGDFKRVYNPGLGEQGGWYINDHCFVRNQEGQWHLFGITGKEPISPSSEDNFAHATSDVLNHFPWEKQPYALSVMEGEPWFERHLWAPHVIEHDGTYYMYYCAGGQDATKYKISLATSKDLFNWERYEGNPVFRDGYHARDPFVLRVGDEWVMYYTANSEPGGGNHVVACRTSTDLLNWGERRIVYTDPSVGTGGGPTESPFVVQRGDAYYLFIGPRQGYVGTDVFQSDSPWHWDLENHVGHIESHAAEVIRDTDGKWYVSHCGWRQGGVYLAPLYWNDGKDRMETSLPIPAE